MKKLSLDKTWTECLRMWKWIARQKKRGSKKAVVVLKHLWMAEHHPNLEIGTDCFFCNYANNYCWRCPTRKIDPDFSCMRSGYHYRTKPTKFYAKLVALNKIRLSRKRSKK